MKAVDKTREDLEDTLKPGRANPPLEPESLWGHRKGQALRKEQLQGRAQSRKTPGAVEEGLSCRREQTYQSTPKPEASEVVDEALSKSESWK